jgi:hypothetical protein
MSTHEFESQFPHYAAVQGHIRRARLERSVHLAEAFATLVHRAALLLKAFAGRMSEGLAADNDRRAIEADVFLRRSVGRY